MLGRIIKGIGGFYYIYVEGVGLVECKAKGIFRNMGIKPMVGDSVEIELLDSDNLLGNLTEIKTRKNELIRPAVSNVDQVIIIFAAADPAPNLNLLDRFLIVMNRQQVKTFICFNKTELSDESYLKELEKIYKDCSARLLFTSNVTGKGIDEVKGLIDGRTTVFAGPSGVGKSTMLNTIYPEACAKSGEISKKIKRGKHTTRHSEIIHIAKDTYIMDTPGFSTLYIDEFEKEELWRYFPEFLPFEKECRFAGCSHIGERSELCGIKSAVAEEKISLVRYESYVSLYKELDEKKKYR